MIDFAAGADGPCSRCRSPGGRFREVMSIQTRRGQGFALERTFCDPCAALARDLEQRLSGDYQALVDGGASPAWACGTILSKIEAALRGEQLAA